MTYDELTYDEIINKWFVKIKTPNRNFGIMEISYILAGYFNEGLTLYQVEKDAIHYTVKLLKKHGYTTTSKIYNCRTLREPQKIPWFYNISLKKIKIILKPYMNTERLGGGVKHGYYGLFYKVGILMKLYDKGFLK